MVVLNEGWRLGLRHDWILQLQRTAASPTKWQSHWDSTQAVPLSAALSVSAFYRSMHLTLTIRGDAAVPINLPTSVQHADCLNGGQAPLLFYLALSTCMCELAMANFALETT